MAQSPTSGAVKALQLELKKIVSEPVEGFRVKLMDEENLFEWEVAIFGPPGTLYEGGYFKVMFQFRFLVNFCLPYSLLLLFWLLSFFLCLLLFSLMTH